MWEWGVRDHKCLGLLGVELGVGDRKYSRAGLAGKESVSWSWLCSSDGEVFLSFVADVLDIPCARML